MLCKQLFSCTEINGDIQIHLFILACGYAVQVIQKDQTALAMKCSWGHGNLIINKQHRVVL